MKVLSKNTKAVSGITLMFDKTALDFAWANRTKWYHNLKHTELRVDSYLAVEKVYDRSDKRYGYTVTIGKFKFTYIVV